MNAAMLLVLVGLFPQDAPKADDPALKNALEAGRRCAKATVEGDFPTLIDMMYPEVVEKAGGREKYLEIARKSLDQMKDQGFKFVSSEAAPASSSARSGEATFCILPTTSVMEIQDTRITVKGFLIGRSTDGGKTWKFLDGSNGEDTTRKLVPSIPADLNFPAKQKPTIEKIKK